MSVFCGGTICIYIFNKEQVPNFVNADIVNCKISMFHFQLYKAKVCPLFMVHYSASNLCRKIEFFYFITSVLYIDTSILKYDV